MIFDTQLVGVIVKAIVDLDFRAKLDADPVATLQELNIPATDTDIPIFTLLRLGQWNTMTINELNDRLKAIEQSGATGEVTGMVTGMVTGHVPD